MHSTCPDCGTRLRKRDARSTFVRCRRCGGTVRPGSGPSDAGRSRSEALQASAAEARKRRLERFRHRLAASKKRYAVLGGVIAGAGLVLFLLLRVVLPLTANLEVEVRVDPPEGATIEPRLHKTFRMGGRHHPNRWDLRAEVTVTNRSSKDLLFGGVRAVFREEDGERVSFSDGVNDLVPANRDGGIHGRLAPGESVTFRHAVPLELRAGFGTRHLVCHLALDRPFFLDR